MSAVPVSATQPATTGTVTLAVPRVGLGDWGAAALSLGVLGIAWYLSSPDAWVHDLVFLAINAGAAVAVLAGVWFLRPARTRVWLAIAAALVIYTLADLSTVIAGRIGQPQLAEVAQGLYVIGYPLFFVAAIGLGTGARRLERVVLVDAAIVGLGSSLLVWELLVEPNMPTDFASGAALVAVAYPVVATLLVTFLVPLLLVRETRSASAILLVGGLALVGIADTHYALALLAGPHPADELANTFWMAGYLAIGVSGIVPSAAWLGASVPRRTPSRDAVRFFGLSLALLVPPVLIVSESSSADPDELRMFGLVAIALAVLIGLRLQRSVGDVVSSDQRFRRFMSHDGLLAVIKDGLGRYIYLNPSGERLSDLPPDSWFGQTDRDLYPPARAERQQRDDEVVRRTGRTLIGTHEEFGRTWLVERFLMPGNHGSIGVLGMDITDKVTAEARLVAAELVTDRWTRERALIADTLSSLNSGRTPEETAKAVCAAISQLPETVIASVVTFGADGFATVVGQVVAGGGSQAGLRLTEARSHYLRERATAGPWVERWVAPPDHPYGAMLARLGVRAHAFAPLRRTGDVIGVLVVGAASPDSITRLTERLPALAEFAQITSALLAPQLADRNATERVTESVRQIIEQATFDMAVQPIVDLATGRVRGYEALARFGDGIPPNEHFRRARDVGLGPQLELACIRRAISEAGRLEPGAWLNVNVSPDVVMTGLLTDVLPLDDRVIVLEITEHEAISDYAAFRAAVARLDSRVKVCVDDAGAGFASLRHIVELAPAFVKLDRSLVAGIATDAARQAVVAGMVRFAETAGLTLIAEGIETEDELAALRRGGVELGQGYLLGRPTIA